MPTELVVLEVDPSRIEQALGNLLANAAKFTEPGGTVSIAAERGDGEAVIRVRDTGMGITADVLPRIFELFTQGGRTLDRSQGGLGIGLTLVRRIVELHGGTIQAKSAGAGRGSEFVVRLPALSGGAADARTVIGAGTPLGQSSRPKRVLIVEDNPDAAESLRLLLQILGHHVRAVHDGLAALEAARANLPDLMLIDIGLPGMDGYELARTIRGDVALKGLLLIALTGYGQPEDRAQATAAGFDYYLVKPVDLDALGQLVSRIGSQTVPGGDTRH
jgi:two-component system CheB/CheR fusion protein